MCIQRGLLLTFFGDEVGSLKKGGLGTGSKNNVRYTQGRHAPENNAPSRQHFSPTFIVLLLQS